MSYTKGPWELKPLEEDAPYLRIRGTQLGGRFGICNVHTEIQYLANDVLEAQANARLIAAAPELLEALKMFVEAGNGNSTDLMQQASAFISAKKAIKKAEGV